MFRNDRGATAVTGRVRSGAGDVAGTLSAVGGDAGERVADVFGEIAGRAGDLAERAAPVLRTAATTAAERAREAQRQAAPVIRTAATTAAERAAEAAERAAEVLADTAERLGQTSAEQIRTAGGKASRAATKAARKSAPKRSHKVRWTLLILGGLGAAAAAVFLSPLGRKLRGEQPQPETDFDQPETIPIPMTSDAAVPRPDDAAVAQSATHPNGDGVLTAGQAQSGEES